MSRQPGAVTAAPDRTVPVESTARVRRRVLVFVVVAYVGAWLVCLPLWLSGRGLATSGATVVLLVMMLTPTLAAFVAHRAVPDGRSFVRAVGLIPGRPRRWLLPGLQALLVPMVVLLASVALAAALGLVRLDLVHFSGYAEMLRDLTGGRALPPVSTGVLVLATALASIPGSVVNAIPAAGEEIGWRGLLQPALSAGHPVLGTLGTGVLWGLWHAPILLLGYNYPTLPAGLRLLAMVAFTTVLSAVLGPLRTRSGTVWVSALAHGSINSWARFPPALVAAGTSVDNLTTGFLGWTGWLCVALWAAVLVLLHRRRRQPAPTP